MLAESVVSCVLPQRSGRMPAGLAKHPANERRLCPARPEKIEQGNEHQNETDDGDKYEPCHYDFPVRAI